MSQPVFDDEALRGAMSRYLTACDALESADGADARDLLDLAEAKAMAGMALRKRLVDLGWTAPTAQRSTT